MLIYNQKEAKKTKQRTENVIKVLTLRNKDDIIKTVKEMKKEPGIRMTRLK